MRTGVRGVCTSSIGKGTVTTSCAAHPCAAQTLFSLRNARSGMFGMNIPPLLPFRCCVGWNYEQKSTLTFTFELEYLPGRWDFSGTLIFRAVDTVLVALLEVLI